MNKRALSRVMAAFLAVVMTLGVFASLAGVRISAVRAEGAANGAAPWASTDEIVYSGENGNMVLGKDARLEADGTYTVQLSAYSTGVQKILEKTAPVATDFIIVVDMSSSMRQQSVNITLPDGTQETYYIHGVAAARAAVNELYASIRQSTSQYSPHRVSLVTFGNGNMMGIALPRRCDHTGFFASDDGSFIGGVQNHLLDSVLEPNYGRAMFDVNDEAQAERFKTVIDTGIALQYQPGTHMGLGMKIAYNIAKLHNHDTYEKAVLDSEGNVLSTEEAPRNQVVILFTDGVPGNSTFNSAVAAEALNYASAIKRLAIEGNKTTVFTTELRYESLWNFRAGEHGQNSSVAQFYELSNVGRTFSARNAEGELDERQLLRHTDGIPYYKRGWQIGGWNTRWWDKNSDEYSEAKVQEALEAQDARYNELGLEDGFIVRDLLYLMSSDYEEQNPDLAPGSLQAYAASSDDMFELYDYFVSGDYRPYEIAGTGEEGHVNETFRDEMYGLAKYNLNLYYNGTGMNTAAVTPNYMWPVYNRNLLFDTTLQLETDRNAFDNGWYGRPGRPQGIADRFAQLGKRLSQIENPDLGQDIYDIPDSMLPQNIKNDLQNGNVYSPNADNPSNGNQRYDYSKGIVYVVNRTDRPEGGYVTVGGNYVSYMISKLVHPNGGYFSAEGYQDFTSAGVTNINLKQRIYKNHIENGKVVYDTDENGDLIYNCKYYIPVIAQNAGTTVDASEGLTTSDGRRIADALLSFEQTTYEQYGEIESVAIDMSDDSALMDTISEWFHIDENCTVEVYTYPIATKDEATGVCTFGTTATRLGSELTINGGTPVSYEDGRIKVSVNTISRQIKASGFNFADLDENVCAVKDGLLRGKKLVVVIKGVLANDGTVGENILTNVEQKSGFIASRNGTEPSEFRNTDGSVSKLLFPKPTVNIRDKYVVYDFGFRLTDDDLTGFFSEGSDNKDVSHIVSVDYMFNRQRNEQGALNYHNVYPYEGARGRDEDGNPIAEYTDELLANEIFKVGFEMSGFNPNAEHPDGDHACTGYFEPHAIARRDYRVAALLKLTDGSYEWSTLTFIPATNVLYEAEQGVSDSNLEGDFVSYTDSTFDSIGDSIGSWSVEGSFDSDSTQEHYNKLYGYDPVYNGKLDCDANGASMKVTVNNDLYEAVKAKTASWPVAKFSFEGSGFSFTTRCALNTGIFIVDVVPKGQDQKYNGTTSHPATPDYTPVEGDNYHTLVNTRYYGGTTEPDGSALLHQIPVFRRGHMPYQAYDVYLTPVYFPAWANDPTQNVSTRSGEEVSMRLDKIIPGIGDIEYTITNAVESGEGDATRAKLTSFTSYIDTIRIYHPRGASVHAMNMDDHEYYAAHEMNAKYVETRSLLINSIQNLNQGGDGGNIAGAIFLDYGPVAEGGDQHFNANDPTTYSISNYVKFGPNNEMYLKGMTAGSDKGGSFTFAIANPDQVTNLHLSMKAHESDQPAQVKITLLLNNPRTKTIEVNSTTEMYYDLLSGFSNYDLKNLKGINIECTGEVTLSIVNLKIVYKDGYVETSETGSVNPNIVTNLETVEFANAIAFGVKGDANGDNAADMTDALLIMRKSLGNDIEFGISATYLSDVNEDGAIDLADALSTMRLALN